MSNTETLDLHTTHLETALAYCAIASIKHFERVTRKPTPAPDSFLHNVRMASSWVSRCRVACKQEPIQPHALLESMYTLPIRDWLPGGPDQLLLEEGSPTDFCHRISIESGLDPQQEAEQRNLVRAMLDLRRLRDRDDAYRSFRESIIRHPVASTDEAALVVRLITLGIADFYSEAQPHHLHRLQDSSEALLYPCPRCGYPMVIQANVLRCSCDTCVQEGARFYVDDGQIEPLGKMALPDALSPEGQYVLRPGIWRYTLIPGLEELELRDRILKVPGTQVVLWPEVDKFDLLVTKDNRNWRIDFKDYSSCFNLSNNIKSIETDEELWIVVPDRSKSFIHQLNEKFADRCELRFRTISQFIKEIGGSK